MMHSPHGKPQRRSALGRLLPIAAAGVAVIIVAAVSAPLTELRHATAAAPSDVSPCYRRLTFTLQGRTLAIKRAFIQCPPGAPPDPQEDPETLALRRCIDTSVPQPRRIGLPIVQGATVAVYGDGDVVSRNALHAGAWETVNIDILRNALVHRRTWRAARLQELGFSREHAEAAAYTDVFLMDIGTNVGAFSVPLSNAGFRVLGFEAMPSNQALLHISQCMNNIPTERLTVTRMGLSDSDRDCQLWVHRDNQGNGKLSCSGERKVTDDNIIVRGDVPLRRLDDRLALRDLRSIVADDPKLRDVTGADAILRSTEYIMKIDVEFHEAEVFRGAVRFLSDKHLRPCIIVMELTWHRQATTDAVELLVSHGYVMLNQWDRTWATNADEVARIIKVARDAYPTNADIQHDAIFMLPAAPVASAAELGSKLEFERVTHSVLEPLLKQPKRSEEKKPARKTVVVKKEAPL